MIIKENQYLKLSIIGMVLLVAVFFLFYNLGHYALWDDEATTALFGQSVWRTGDTHAVIDPNIIAYNSGVELRGLRNRYIPPLSFYLVAPFVGLFPGSAFAARLPFALCGLLTIILMLRWLWRSNASLQMWLLISAGILGNVSLMLFFRQCRYYGPTIFFSTLLAYLYFYRDNRIRTYVLMAIVSLLLLASNYLCYAGVLATLFVNYVFWGRKIYSLKFKELLIFLVPQLIFGGVLIRIYNLSGNNLASRTFFEWILLKMNMFCDYLGQINNNEVGVGVFILLAPVLQRYTKEKRLFQCYIAIITYTLVVTFLSPELFDRFSPAPVRYLIPLIPVCIFIAVLSIQVLSFRQKWLMILLAVLAFGTNVLHGGPVVGTDYLSLYARVIAQGRYRATVVDFTKELISPPPSAYRLTADWVNKNIKDHESVWVIPSYQNYPLMYHAPNATYAWQLDERVGQFSELPEIHFNGKIAPDYIIVFGPYAYGYFVGVLQKELPKWAAVGIYYDRVKTIDKYWYDLIRPELFWHSFKEVKNFFPEGQAIHIMKKRSVKRSNDEKID